MYDNANGGVTYEIRIIGIVLEIIATIGLASDFLRSFLYDFIRIEFSS